MKQLVIDAPTGAITYIYVNVNYVKCLEVYSLWFGRLCSFIHVVVLWNYKSEFGMLSIASNHVLISSHSANWTLFTKFCNLQSLWKIKYCLFIHCWHKSTWNMKLVLCCIMHSTEADSMILGLSYGWYWQV